MRNETQKIAQFIAIVSQIWHGKCVAKAVCFVRISKLGLKWVKQKFAGYKINKKYQPSHVLHHFDVVYSKLHTKWKISSKFTHFPENKQNTDTTVYRSKKKKNRKRHNLEDTMIKENAGKRISGSTKLTGIFCKTRRTTVSRALPLEFYR